MEKVVIHLINSLGNGGAERVVANLSNESVLTKKTFIITLFKTENSYNINDSIEVISLSNKKNNKLVRLLCLPWYIYKLNSILRRLFNSYEIELVTCHLRFMQFIASLSLFSTKIIYVLHESLYTHKDKWWFKLHLKIIYENKVLVAVSNGVEREIQQEFNVNPRYITTIYNPINTKVIKQRANEKFQNNFGDYFLFCGRLTKIKDPLEALFIFYDGKFYEKYKLVYSGVGELEEEIRQTAKSLNIFNSVIFLGWTVNPYIYMKHASLLINSSISEAFPMTLIEALCVNCKVVSYDIKYGPNELLIDNLSPFLVENRNRKSMIKCIENAIENYPENLEEKASKYDCKRILTQYYEIYSEIIRGGK